MAEDAKLAQDDDEVDIKHGTPADAAEEEEVFKEAEKEADEDIPANTPPEKKKESGIFRLKKFWASKTAESKMGRKIIFNVLGPIGHRLLSNLKEATALYSSEKEATNKRKALLKLALKVKLLVDEKIITDDQFEPAFEPLFDFCKHLLKLLQTKGEEKQQIEAVTAEAQKVIAAVLPIIKGKMKDKNYQLASDVLQFYANPGFIAKVVTDEKYAQLKVRLFDDIDLLTKPVLMTYKIEEEELHVLQPLCMEQGCRARRLPRGKDDRFPGSVYCTVHHMDHVKAETAKPQLSSFLSDSIWNGYFYQYLVDLEDQIVAKQKAANLNAKGVFSPANLLRFRRLAMEYKEYSQNVRMCRADAVFSKFLGKRAQPIDRLNVKPEVVATIKDQLSNAPRTLFEPVVEAVNEMLVAHFTAFAKSPFFKAWQDAMVLSKEFLPQIPKDQAIIEQTKKDESKDEKKQ